MGTTFAGLDWASRAHAVCIVDEAGGVVARFDVAHDAEGLRDLVRRLKAAKVKRIAIERPSGLLVDALVEAQFEVVPIHPNVVKAMRPRYRSSGAKSDAGDAYLLADLLRTDGHRFGTLKPESDQIRSLRALVRGRDGLLAARVRLANQLRALLQSFWHGPTELFADLDSVTSLAFLRRYPTPRSARSLGVKRMAAFCAAQGYSGRRSPEELVQRLREAPTVTVSESESQAKGLLVLGLVHSLTELVKQITTITRRIEHDIVLCDDGPVFTSLPRSGRLNAAQILAEIGSVRERYADEAHLAGEAGVVPVTRESGKTRCVTFRWACNQHLRGALNRLADNSRHDNAWAAHVYAAARARGCDHPHAIRILARAWLRVIWRMWIDRKPYDPTKHRGAQPWLSPTGGLT